MKDIKNVNYIFFATMLIILGASLIPFHEFVSSKLTLLLISQALLAIPAVMYFAGTKSKYRDTVGLKRIPVSTMLLTVLFTFCMLPVMGLVNGLSRLYAVDSTTGMMTEITNRFPFLISLLCIAVVPAILEESVYRGIFYQKYRKINPLGAIFLSAFLFGILHGNLNQFTYAFFMGIIFALIIEATDSIVASMIMHFVINGNSVIMMYVLPRVLNWFNSLYQDAIAGGNKELAQKITESVGSTDFTVEGMLAQASEVSKNSISSVLASYGVMALIGAVLAFLLYRTIAKRSNRWEHVKDIFARRECRDGKIGFLSMWTWPLTSAVVILVINMIMNELMMRGLI